MERFLRSLLIDLERRTTVLKERAEAVDTDHHQELREHTLLAYRYLETVRRSATQLAGDPTLGHPQLMKNQLQLYERWSETVSLVEWYLIPVVERYSERDQNLTRLCHRLAKEVRWPTLLPLPVVASFSNQYYWTKPEFNLIAVPTGEGLNPLTFPDLCHEMGHILLLYYPRRLVGGFALDLNAYFLVTRLRSEQEQRPPAYREQVNRLFALWKDVWVFEFAADMLATYLIGPAFGWQHLRLCASSGSSVYFPALGDTSEHPADAARMEGIQSMLACCGAREPAERIRDLWDEYLAVTGEGEPGDYAVCYPQALIRRLAEHVMQGCASLQVKRFDERGAEEGIVELVERGWERFLEKPEEYGEWVGGAIKRLSD